MNYPDRRKQEMYDWFHERFMEPEAVKHDKNEANKYLYSCGGPYCAKDIITSNFKGIFPDEVIKEVVKDLESERPEWVLKKIEAPSSF
jgi:hypothetical protein